MYPLSCNCTLWLPLVTARIAANNFIIPPGNPSQVRGHTIATSTLTKIEIIIFPIVYYEIAI
jgi:hypothetical protein